ncbi:MAG: SDR family oxidoreductase [Gemmatimonadota bacterium]
MDDARKRAFRDAAEAAARAQRAIQQGMERRDRARDEGDQAGEGAVQAGPRRQPAPPLPEQHLAKPGAEHELEPRPRYHAPAYRGSGKLDGMVALITGGDSGIGRAVAVLFAREGANVAITYLDEHEDAEETRRAVEKEGARCVTMAGDVRDPAFCDAAVDYTLSELGRIDVLVNNAAFQLHVQQLEELTDDHLEMTLQTNIQGYIQMARAALPHLPQGGSIINTGSETGLFGQPILLDYSATKGAIHAFTKALAENVASRGIRVNAVAPGPVWTPLNPADRPAEAVRDFGGTTSMKRPAQPEEVAPAYVFLAAPSCASYITGAILPVMGGPTGG